MPAEKRRKMDAGNHKRVIQKIDNIEKREEHEEEDEQPAKKRKEEEPAELVRKVPETETRWEDKETEEIRWKKMLKDRQIRMETEETERKERRAKAERLEKSWALLRLCRELMAKEGLNWKISRERRDDEKQKEVERFERKKLAEKNQTMQKLHRKTKKYR